MPRTGSGWLSRGAALLLGTAVACMLGEALLRALRPSQVSLIRFPCIYTPDPQFGYRYLPNASGVLAGHFEFENLVSTNSLGFHDDEPLPAARAHPRILAVGDSFTAALSLTQAQTWTAVLERELAARGFPDADVVNLGLDGTGTDVHVAVIREYVELFRPDVVLLAFFANDLGDVLAGRFQRECYRGYVLSYPDAAWRERQRARVDAHFERPLRRWLYQSSYLVRLLSSLFMQPLNPYRAEFLQPRRAELPSGPEVDAAGKRRWNAAVHALQELARDCDCTLRVVPVAPRPDPQGTISLWLHAPGTSEIPLLDLGARIQELRVARGLAHEDLYFRRDNHLNVEGNAIFAQALADRLLDEPELLRRSSAGAAPLQPGRP